ncbi:hypothetical protein [Microbacterium pumilum]|uniref:Helix-turn-helix domain-containing protein n=1 Tax=Microbacterium pumilum TaxID=344165 RepID=A0ABN2T2D3_9MICO
MATTDPTPTVYRISTAPEHPLAKKYGITERMVRRAVQTDRLKYARPNGLHVLILAEDIEAWILDSRNDA